MSRLHRSHPLRVRFTRLTLVSLTSLALSVGVLGCRTPSSKIPLDQLSAADQDRSEGEAREVLEPLPIERPSDLLPAEVAIMAEAIDPAALFNLVGSLDEYPMLIGPRGELVRALGGDILDPERWHELGLDSHGPAGMGLLDLASGGGFMYGSLVDEAKFEQTLLRFADMIGVRDELATAEVGDARIYRLSRGLSVVVRGKVAIVVFVDDVDRAPRDYVVAIATVDPRESLAHTERFAWARQQLQPADDGMVFINPRGLLEQFEQEARTRNDDYGTRYAEEELARARKFGEPAERVRELEQRVEQERAWTREREAREAGKRELVTSLFGSVGAVVAAADLREDGIVGHGRVQLPADALLRRLFVAPEHESPLLTALGERPVFAVDGRADLAVLLELVDLLAHAEGETLASVNAEVLRDTGVDMLSDVIAALSGEGGFALTESRKPDFKHMYELSKSFGLAAYVGLTDAQAIRKTLDGMVRNRQVFGALVRAARGDGWTMRVPGWREVEINIVGDRLVISTDTKLAKRVREAEPGAEATALGSAEHPFRGPLVTPALRVYGRWSGLAVQYHRESWDTTAESMLYDMNSHHELSVDEAAKVPHSREFKRKLAELETIVAELNRFDQRQAVRRSERYYEFLSKIGDFGVQVEPLADGLAVQAQWRFAKGMSPMQAGYSMFVAGSDEDWREREPIGERSYRVAEELRQLRRAELDAAAAKRQRPNP